MKQYQQPDAEIRDHIAENMKERIYSTITLIALITTLWATVNHHSVKGIIGGIAGTVIALWLATLISSRISYRAVHGREMSGREYRKSTFAASGLLAPAVAPIILVLISLSGLLSLKTALMTSIVLLLLSLLFFSFVASRKIYDKPLQILLVSGLEMSVGLLVVGLKLLLGE